MLKHQKILCLLLVLFLVQANSATTYRQQKNLKKHINLMAGMKHKDQALLQSHAQTDLADTYPRISEYTGRSYDIFVGNPLGYSVDDGFDGGKLIFALTYDSNVKTTDNEYFIPNEIVYTMDLSCSYSSQSKEYTGMKEYQDDLKVAAEVSGGYKGVMSKVSFTASTAYESMSDTVSSQEKISVLTKARCDLYKGVLPASTTTLSEDFLLSVAQAKESGDWTSFVYSWGTHYTTTVTYGAMAIQETTFTKSAYSKLESIGIDVSASVNAKFGSAKGSASCSVSNTEIQQTAFESAISSTTANYVGQPPPSSSDIGDWISDIKNGYTKPVPINFELAPMTDLFDEKYFGSLYTSAQLLAMQEDLDTAIVDIASTLDGVSDLYTSLFPAYSVLSTTPVLGLQNTTSHTSVDDTPSDYVLLRPSKIWYCTYTSSSGYTFLTGLKLTVTDDAFTSDLNTHGKCSSGTWNSWTLSSGEQITQIRVSLFFYMSGIQFYTSWGRTSPQMGYIVKSSEQTLNIAGDVVGIRSTFDFSGTDNFFWNIGFQVKTIIYPHTTTIVPGGTDMVAISSSGGPFLDTIYYDTQVTMRKITMYFNSGLKYIKATVINEETGETIDQTGHGVISGTLTTLYPSSEITQVKVCYSTSTGIEGLQFYYADGTNSGNLGTTSGTCKYLAISGYLTGFYGNDQWMGVGNIPALGFLYNQYL